MCRKGRLEQFLGDSLREALIVWLLGEVGTAELQRDIAGLAERSKKLGDQSYGRPWQSLAEPPVAQDAHPKPADQELSCGLV